MNSYIKKCSNSNPSYLVKKSMTYRFNIIIYMLRVNPANRILLITKTQINMTNNKIS